MIARDDIFKTHPLLSLLPRAAASRLVSQATIAVHPKGEIIYEEAASCRALYLVLSGRCESFQRLPNGTEKTVEILGPGDTFGDRNLSCLGNYRTTVRVITDSVLQRLDSAAVHELLAERTKTTAEESTPSPCVISPSRPGSLGRIVTLLSLSPSVPDGEIAHLLARYLASGTGESVLVVSLVTSGGRLTLSDWAAIQTPMNGEFQFDRYLSRMPEGYHQLDLQLTGAPPEQTFIAPLLSHLDRHFRYVLVHSSADKVPLPAVIECMIQTDAAYLFLKPAADSVYQFNLLKGQVKAQHRGSHSAIKPVVCLRPGENAQKAVELFRPEAPGVHTFLRDCPDSNFAGHNGQFGRDIRRLAREIARRRIGLALSSGGAKGLAHIGVIQVLEENGIEVDVVAGCSMGAYIASVWACGFDGAQMEKLARELEGRWGLWKIVDPAIPPRKGFILGNAVRNRLKRSIGESQFHDTVLPLRIVATNLDTLERVVIDRGEVAMAVHASSAIPGVCVPVRIGDVTYIDGGVSDPLPIDVLMEMGIEHIIAVNTIPTPAFLRCCREMEREQEELQGGGKGVLDMLNSQLNYFARGNILDIMMRAVHGAQIRVAEEMCRNAGVVLRPLAIDARWHDFTNPRKYIALGRKVAEEHLEEIKALIRTTGRKNDEKPTQIKVAALA